MRVDLPMPGSPPINTSEPGTMPPPSTRFSSSSPVPIRYSGEDSISSSVFAEMVFERGVVCLHSFLLFPSSFDIISSAKLFQELHDGHFPSHLADSYPQL